MPSRLSAIRDLWPTALAIAMSILTVGGGDADEQATSLAQPLLLLPLLYLVVAKFRWRRATWAVLGGLIVPYAVLRALDAIAPSVAVAVVALTVLVWSVLDGHLRRSAALQAQALGMAGFGVLALAGLIVDPDLGRYVVAAGWFLHGIWDLVHLKLDKVVTRSYAQWCAVIDILIAVQLVFLI